MPRATVAWVVGARSSFDFERSSGAATAAASRRVGRGPPGPLDPVECVGAKKRARRDGGDEYLWLAHDHFDTFAWEHELRFLHARFWDSASWTALFKILGISSGPDLWTEDS